MALPWVRLDTGIASHDKTLSLLSDPSPKRWQAMCSYMFGLAWCGDHGTDGRIPAAALPFLHGTKATASLLVAHGLWDDLIPAGTGWLVPKYVERQELAVVTEIKRARQRQAARRTNCRRYHGVDCECWKRGDGDESDIA